MAVSSTWRNYTHDSRGNVSADGKHTFSYDFANQPISATGTVSGNYSYDGNLKRVKESTAGETIYSIYDKSGSLLIRDNVTSNKKTTYVNLAGQTVVRITNGVPSYPLNDQSGSAFMVADKNGVIASSNVFNYTPFGESIAPPFGGASNDPGNTGEQGYTGHIEDKTGLTYMLARYYDPVIGRFLQTDPVGYADQQNLYAYVHNDPVNRIDPDGQFAFLIPLAIVAYRAYSAYDTVTSTIENVGTLNSSEASGFEKTMAVVGIASSVACGSICGKATGGISAAIKNSDVVSNVTKYEVGTFNDLTKRSDVGDNLDIHHAVQQHPASQVIDGYDPKTAPSIAVPAGEHKRIPTMKGEYSGNARDLLAKDIKDLRNNTNAPNKALQTLIRLNKETYPDAFTK